MNIQFPISWMRDFIKTDVAAKTLATQLTACGPSVEKTDKTGEDYIIDVEVTTNRPDAFSVYGIAREAHAILKSQNQKSTLLKPKGTNTSLEPDNSGNLRLDVLVTSSKLCPRFTAIVLTVKVKESPAYIKNRLKASGIRPINNIVDITNYIMLELGQPMHAFDYDKIEGAKMVLRESKQGEKVRTLDGILRQLPTGSIVIQDKKKIVDLCGIMGAENSQITSRTKRAIFFVQAYNPQKIRKTAQALAFRTDAATRFEKGVDLENILPTLSRSIYLAKEIASAKIASELIDIYPVKQKSQTINLRFEKLDRYVGFEMDHALSESILKNLGFNTKRAENNLSATAPAWRANDITSDVDLIEEIARVYGYHNLPSKLPKGETPNREDSILKQAIELKKALKLLGMTEVVSYSIISKSMLKSTGVNQKDAVELANPLTEEWQFMRPTIITSLLDVLSKNKSIKHKINIFEIAKTYKKQSKSIPVQDLKICLVLAHSSFYELKGLLENLFEITRRTPSFERLEKDNMLFEKSESATVKVGAVDVGNFGIIDPQVADALVLDSDVAIAELNLTSIYGQPAKTIAYHTIPKYPPVIEDISAIFSAQTPLAKIISEIKTASSIVKKVEVLDIFEDSKLGDLKKSVTIRLNYQKSSGTPSQDEVGKERIQIIEALEQNLRAKVRR